MGVFVTHQLTNQPPRLDDVRLAADSIKVDEEENQPSSFRFLEKCKRGIGHSKPKIKNITKKLFQHKIVFFTFYRVSPFFIFSCCVG